MNVTDRAGKTVRVHYYALLREERGAREESLSTDAETARQLYQDLRQRYGFSLDAARLRVAVNDRFRDWDTPLEEGDSVVFIPPVAGG